MTVSRQRAEKCITHHHACDCREYYFQNLEQALKVISVWATTPDIDSNVHIAKLCNDVLALKDINWK